MSQRSRNVLVVYPETEKYTTDALTRALLPEWNVSTSKDDVGRIKKPVDLQYCDYDELDWNEAERQAA